jgi:hypothetical protein
MPVMDARATLSIWEQDDALLTSADAWHATPGPLRKWRSSVSDKLPRLVRSAWSMN